MTCCHGVEVRGDLRNGIPCRHKAVKIDELVLKRALPYLNQVEKDVGGDEKDIDDRIVPGPIRVPDRYHGSPCP